MWPRDGDVQEVREHVPDPRKDCCGSELVSVDLINSNKQLADLLASDLQQSV